MASAGTWISIIRPPPSPAYHQVPRSLPLDLATITSMAAGSSALGKTPATHHHHHITYLQLICHPACDLPQGLRRSAHSVTE
jgi:hypothetical protein